MAGQNQAGLVTDDAGLLYFALVGRPHRGPGIEYYADVTFLEGSMSDYHNGRVVKLKMTPAGQKKALEASMAQYRSMLQVMGKQVSDRYKGKANIQFEMRPIVLEGDYFIHGDLNRLELIGGSSKSSLILKLELLN